MFTKVDFQAIQFFPGGRFGLSGRSAVVTLSLDQPFVLSKTFDQLIRDQLADFHREEPFFGINATDWPQAFLVGRRDNLDFGYWVVALTVAIQRWARDPVDRGCVLEATEQTMTIALPWHREDVCRAALNWSLQLLHAWLFGPLFNERALQLIANFKSWLTGVQVKGMAPSTLRFADAARRRDIPVSAKGNLLALGWGSNLKRLDSSFTGNTSTLATGIARSKIHTSQILAQGGVPVPANALVNDFESALKVARQLGWPVVIKPTNQDQGVGVTPGITTEEELKRAFERAEKHISGFVIVEKHVEGADYRMLVVGNKLMAVTKRTPAGIIGDGLNSIEQLVDIENQNPLRGNSKRSMLIALSIDEEALFCLQEVGMTPKTVPAPGQFVRLRRIGNISSGGTAHDVTACVHPDNQVVAERAARLIGLDIAGVDFLCPDISQSWRNVGGAVCEVNAQPGFRVHWLGDPNRDINGEVIDWLYQGSSARIPTTAITGTNGKTTVARMVHTIFMAAGKLSGVTTTHGLWIGNDLINNENLSGFPGARILLEDPAVEAAVIELPRKGLIKFGHPCDRYDVSALMNIQDDHIGVDGINSMAAMARLKAEILERARQAVVINAEDPLCMAMRSYASTNRHILVAHSLNCPELIEHTKSGHEGVFVLLHEGARWIAIADGDECRLVMRLADIPATMNGFLEVNEKNALFAVALAYAQGIPDNTIYDALSGFSNTVEDNPGRYNFVEGFPFKVLLDNGHNPDGVKNLCDAVSQMDTCGQRHLLTMKIGNRHKIHWEQVSSALAQTFDSILLGCAAEDHIKRMSDYAADGDIRLAVLHTGRDALLNAGMSTHQIQMEAEPERAIRHVLSIAKPGDLVVILANPWQALPILDACTRDLNGFRQSPAL